MDIESTRDESERRNLTEQDAKCKEEKRGLAELGIGFDGCHYRYDGYRYERCADAVNYARLDRSRHAYRERTNGEPSWMERAQPTDAERQRMAELGITFDGRAYSFKGYRYDRLVDAIAYARLRR